MDALQRMRLFARAIELGSFSAVAREENSSQPTISKAIAALESDLGVRLLQRTTTHLAATEEGRRFYERCKRVLEDYADAIAEVRGQAQRVAGGLRVSAPMGLGQLRLNKLMMEFLKQHPDVEIELVLNDRMVDLVEEAVDVAIRLGEALPPHVTARTLAFSPRVLVAAPTYLRSAARIERPEDLQQHQVICFAGMHTVNPLECSLGAEKLTVVTHGRYRVNSSLALRHCFLEGMGIGTAPAWSVQDLIDSGQLVRLLPGWDMGGQRIHLVYLPRSVQPPRTRALLEFMSERIRGLPGFHAAFQHQA